MVAQTMNVQNPKEHTPWNFQNEYAFLKSTMGKDENIIALRRDVFPATGSQRRRLYWAETGWVETLDAAAIFEDKNLALKKASELPKPEEKHSSIFVTDVRLEETLCPDVGYPVHGSANKPIFKDSDNASDFAWMNRHIYKTIGDFEMVKETAGEISRVIVVEKASKKKHVFYFAEKPPVVEKRDVPIVGALPESSVRRGFTAARIQPVAGLVPPGAPPAAPVAPAASAAPVAVAMKNDEIGRLRVLAAALHAFKGMDVEPVFDTVRSCWFIKAETPDKKFSLTFDAMTCEPGILKTGVGFLKKA